MLRTSLRSVRVLGTRPIAASAARQWQPVIARPAGAVGRRCYADEKKQSIEDPKPAKLPTNETITAAKSDPPSLKIDTPEVEAREVPLTPPTPEATAATTTTTNTTAPPPPPLKKKKKGFFRRLRNYVLTLILLGAVSFGGGVWYSRINDNFHDFFTEYVPFGEQAVLYLEELDFQKRYPRMSLGSPRSKDTGDHVKIQPQSGASWRVADSGEPAGRQTSAVRHVAASKDAAASPQERQPPVTKAKPSPEAPAEETVPVAKSAEAPKAGTVASEKAVQSADKPAWIPPEVNEPSRYPPPTPIDPLNVNDAEEPVVQELCRMLNDIITVVNADNAGERFSATMYKAKDELNKIGSHIRDIKAMAEADAASQVTSKIKEFEAAAGELVGRVERAMAAQEAQWRKEFEEEMRRVREAYEARFKTERERERLVNEEKLKNKLLEQAIELKRQFLSEVRDRVESERDSRLGRLEELSSAVKELEKLTTGWNDVVDMNLKTQQLHVAVEAVRASLEDAEHPRPFVRELVALKEIASDDPVVSAAIHSINPSAYQRGIATPAQLVDRFRRVAAEVRKASLLPEDAGVASHASSLVLSKVLFRKQGLAAGDDVESILTRTQTLLEEGNLDAAAREVNGLQGWAKTLSRDWLAEVRKVLEVQQALDVIATEARLQSLKVEG
ncbi:hypothetical protein DL764_001260 [Monosporascus ibericus]|uniref:MICOS complex subunit MIC60 n=1 Tax=Monosporascus ibericus TaxID=155417 RepID=A0A4Q4TQ98_9PEZI|nr:hypothetical protein DL764_001260 [Monosporascus ibericus]